MSINWVTLASTGTICTGLRQPISSGPIAVPLVRRGTDLVRICAACRPGITSTLAGAGQPAERVECARSAGSSATSAAISPSYSKSTWRSVEQLHRVADAAGDRALGVAEGGEGQEGDARLVPQAPRRGGRLDRDVGQRRRVRAVRGSAVSATKTVPETRASIRVSPNRRPPGAGSMTRGDVLQRDRIAAGDAGDHGIGIAQRHHAGGEDIAVLVDQALAVAEQEALRCWRA